MYRLLQSVFGLSYITSDDGFSNLIANAPLNVEHFTDYMIETFIDDNSLYPTYLWEVEPSLVL